MPNDLLTTPTNSNAPAIIYKPSEILGMIASYFSQKDVTHQTIFVQDVTFQYISECIMLIKSGEMPIDDSERRHSHIDFYTELIE